MRDGRIQGARNKEEDGMTWKATLLGAVLLAAWVSPSFAEVENVRVGGDITVRAFHRENLDLRANDGTLDDEDDFFMTTTGINMGADLTENVSAFIRLANERDWNVDGTATGDFDASQAFIELKELFYAPLSVKVGTQPIVWGRGFVLGSNLLPSILLGAGADRNAAITANEFTDFTAFDAIRATLDLSNVGGMNLPLTLDYVYIKQDENATGSDDDVQVQGANLSARFDMGEAETYLIELKDNSPAGVLKDGDIYTMGLRGSAAPVEGANFWGEMAYQFGTRVTDLEVILAVGGRHSAWAANLGADYTLADVAMTPKFGAEWRYYSGEDTDAAAAGWRAIAPGYFTTAIREFQTRSTVAGFYPTDQAGVTSGASNQHEFGLFAGAKPLEDLGVNTRLSWFFLPVGAIPPGGGSPKRNNYIGTEWDTVVNYAYTDDVQLGVIYALFLPGNVFRATGNTVAGGESTAQELITSVSVKF